MHEVEGDLAVVAADGKADPEEREGLEEAGLAERAGVDGVEAQSGRQIAGRGFGGGIIAAVEEGGRGFREGRIVHDVGADGVEDLDDAGAGGPFGYLLGGRGGV